MVVTIEGSNKEIDISKLPKIGSGQDGELFKFDDIVFKLNTSDYMTHEKFEDLVSTGLALREKGINVNKSTLIFPKKKICNPKHPVKKLIVTPLFGYTQRYVLENTDGIAHMSTSEFIEGTTKIFDDIQRIFSPNDIAICDTNPQNLLVTPEHKIYFIDFDRNITKSSMPTEKQIVKDGNYFIHNEARFAQVINRALLMQIYYHHAKSEKEKKRLLEYMNKEERKCPNISTLYSCLDGYETIDEYAQDKGKKLFLKK